jgi:hypothetical protein
MNKGLSSLLALFIGLLAVGAAGYAIFHKNESPQKQSDKSDSVMNPRENSRVGSDRDEHGCIGSAGYVWCESKQKCLRAWEEQCQTVQISEGDNLKQAVKQQIVAKHGDNASELTIDVSKISGGYAKGSASAAGGGGLWFAAKVNNAWKLVWDGNGIILCTDLSDYPDFPKSMIPECYNDQTSQMVIR